MITFAKLIKDFDGRMNFGGAKINETGLYKNTEHDVQIWRDGAQKGSKLNTRLEMDISSEAKILILEKIKSLEKLAAGKNSLSNGIQTINTKTLINSTQTKIYMTEITIESLAQRLTVADKRSLLNTDYFKANPKLLGWGTNKL